jgi:hypothetical protein
VQVEQNLGDSKGAFSTRAIPRSRRVGQSYVTSILSTLYSSFHCLTLLLAER